MGPARRRRRWSVATSEGLEARRLLAIIEPSTLERAADPVVMSGADVPATLGWNPGDVVAFRDVGNGWEQVPVQVDERVSVDIGQVYNNVDPSYGGEQILA